MSAPTPKPPLIVNAPEDVDTAFNVLKNVPVVSATNLPPIYKFPPIPAPPLLSTTNAPVFVLIDCVEVVIRTPSGNSAKPTFCVALVSIGLSLRSNAPYNLPPP